MRINLLLDLLILSAFFISRFLGFVSSPIPPTPPKITQSLEVIGIDWSRDPADPKCWNHLEGIKQGERVYYQEMHGNLDQIPAPSNMPSTACYRGHFSSQDNPSLIWWVFFKPPDL